MCAMKSKYIWILLIAWTTALMSGCKADVDLNNIDTHAEVAWKVAFPIGSMTAEIGDFVGDSQVPNLFVDDSSCILYFRDTAHVTRQYHDLDLASKISSAHKKCYVHDKIPGSMLHNDTVTGNGKTILLDFPFIMHLKNINDSLQNERLDSASISKALFKSVVSTSHFNLDPKYIQHIEIKVGDEFRYIQNNLITVYDSTTVHEDFEYNTPVDIHVEKFVVDLLDHDQSTETKFVVTDSVLFHILFYVKIPKSTHIYVPSNATFEYNMNVQFINYDAIWGYFNPSNKMHDEGNFDLYNELDIWKHFKKAKLPIADPEVNLFVTTQVAGAMNMHGAYIYSQTKGAPLSNRQYATFDEAMTQREVNYLWNKEGVITHPGLYERGYLHPIHSAIGDSVRYRLLFDKNWKNGHIDNLFTIRPDSLGYKFEMFFDTLTTPQIRIVPNTYVRIDADFNLPFRFNKGVELQYDFRIDSVNLSKLTLDSLLASVKKVDTVKTSTCYLVMEVNNAIPLDMQGVLRFYDAKGEMIMDPIDPSHPLRFGTEDTLHFEHPDLVWDEGEYVVSQPGKSMYILYLEKQHFDIFAAIKSIQIELFADAQEINQLYPNYRVKISDYNNIKLGLGITTNADVVFDLNK